MKIKPAKAEINNKKLNIKLSFLAFKKSKIKCINIKAKIGKERF